MASIEYNHLILDLLVPCIFAFAIYLLCMYLKKWKYITYFFSVLGHSSLTIYFTHAALLYVLAPLIGQPIAVACCNCRSVVSAYIHKVQYYKNIVSREYEINKNYIQV